jgi:transcriptional regulator with XRE-family HTH domain
MRMKIGEMLGSQIATARKRRNLKQAHLAELISVATETVSRFERGASVPSIKTLEKIGKALRTPMKEFFTLDQQVSTVQNERQNELDKVIVLLQNKKKTDIQLSYRVLKALFK